VFGIGGEAGGDEYTTVPRDALQRQDYGTIGGLATQFLQAVRIAREA
jgi:hypothetical protein